MIKFYLLQFCCFHYRVVHLEVVVAPHSAENILLAIQRFSASRERMDFLYTDNAQSFISARNDINKIFQSKQVQDRIKKHPLNIFWKTSCPKTPNTNASSEV